ncbi:HDIG domain-containing protein [bacterium]|nr:HDIG domain-containing protein [bacterium]
MRIPKSVKYALQKLEENGFDAYIVGGCVRDLLLKRRPKDWDIATSAKPEQIQKIFPDSFYQNKFGTVTARIKERKNIREIQITTYRKETKYTDKRHPDKVKWAKTLKEDLKRRDFTINAMAMEIAQNTKRPLRRSEAHPVELGGKAQGHNLKLKANKFRIIDLFNGQQDLKDKLIRAVGNPKDRFSEDALRMMRAVRFAVELNFDIEKNTFNAIEKNAYWIQAISKERIRDELIKIIMSDKPDKGIELLRKTGLLTYIIPELENGVGVSQNRHHIYTIYTHLILSLKYAALRKYNLAVRLAALFHDIAKPQTKKGEWPDATFYNHDVLGAKFAIKILQRLKFPKKLIEKVAILVRNHMFVYDIEKVSEAGVRRLIRRVGMENIPDLIKLRICDRLGSGCPKAVPYKLRHLQYVIERVSKDPISVKMLNINGNDIMDALKISPGPRIGLLLNALLSEVLENPKRNKKEYLIKRAKELNKLSDKQLKELTQKVKEKKEEVDMELKQKYWVK